VTSNSTLSSRYPSVAMDSEGGFVVVWQATTSPGTDTSRRSIQGRRYDAAAGAFEDQFQVNTYTPHDQELPSVAMDADGDFVVVWQSIGSYWSDRTIQGQRYDSNGGALGGEFQVNTYTPINQMDAAVAMHPDGGFVVVWTSYGSLGTDPASTSSIQARYYTRTGEAPGGQFQVNTYTTSGQGAPSIAFDLDGDFVVSWASFGSFGGDIADTSVQARRYALANTVPSLSATALAAAALLLVLARSFVLKQSLRGRIRTQQRSI
jgi:hypothetical protein